MRRSVYLLLSLLMTVGCAGGSSSTAPDDGTTAASPPDDPAEATIESLQTHCNAGDAPSCLNLAIRHEFGQGVDEDVEEARNLYEKACNMGSMHACYGLARVFRDETDEPLRAGLLLEYTCREEHSPSCLMLGEMYDDGIGFARDADEALKYYSKSCEGGYDKGCNAYIEHIWTANEQLVELSRFIEFLETHCNRGHSPSCSELAELYDSGVSWSGEQLPRDEDRATALRVKARLARHELLPGRDYEVLMREPPPASAFAESEEEPATVTAEPEPKPMKLLIESTSEGLVVFVDDVRAGTTPATVTIRRPGPHRIELRNTDGELLNRRIVLVGEGATQKMTLEPQGKIPASDEDSAEPPEEASK